MSASRSGHVVTFYSYKGGTGRSQALANVAWILASNQQKVLIIDWDLEAPGLHRYFSPFLPDETLSETDGLIEFILNYATQTVISHDSGESSNPEWYLPLVDIARYAISIDYPFEGDGTIDLVPAGRQGQFYADRVRSFDWENFYNRLGGGGFLEETRRRFVSEYDYILIDSRTGVSDTSGICTVQLPDTLVACFTANNQSIDGVSAVAASIRRSKGPREKPVRFIPLLSRVDFSEDKKLKRRKQLVRLVFDEYLPREWTHEFREKYWGEVQIPYIPFYAYEEVLAPFNDLPGDKYTLLAAVEQLTAAITDNKFGQLGLRPTKDETADALNRYTRHRWLTSDLLESLGPEISYDVFLSYHSGDNEYIRPIVDRLRHAGIRFFSDESDLVAGQNVQEELRRAFDRSKSCLMFVGTSIGRWQTFDITLAEERRNLNRRFRVIPVLLPGATQASLPAFLSDTRPIDLERGLDDAIYQIVSGIHGTPIGSKPTPDECPYRGTAPFGLNESRLFFGRDELVKDLIHRIQAAKLQRTNRLFGIVGPSGSGKSSLACAGLLAALSRGEIEGSALWPVVTLVPGSDPLENLFVALSGHPEFGQHQSLLNELRRSMPSQSDALHLALRQMLARSQSDRSVVLLVDQLDEIFVHCKTPVVRDAFIANLVHSANAESGNVVVIFTARNDVDPVHFGSLGVNLEELQLLWMPVMSRDQLRQAIERPAAVVDCLIDPIVVNRLIQDVYQQPGALTFLQLTLVELWNRRRDGRITDQAFKEIGGTAGIVYHHADGVFERLKSSEKVIFSDILLRLADSAPTGAGNLGREPLLEITANRRDAQLVESVIQQMTDARVLTTDLDVSATPFVIASLDIIVRTWPRVVGWKDERTAKAPQPELAAFPDGRAAVFPTTRTEPPLSIYVVWHPRWNDGETIGRALYSRFARDVQTPLSRGMGIPVYFRSEPWRNGESLPAPIPMGESRWTVVVVFVSSQMVVDESWAQYVGRIVDEMDRRESRIVLIPVAASSSAFSFSTLRQMNFLRLFGLPDNQKLSFLLTSLTGRIGQVFHHRDDARANQRVELFLSHAKVDGMRLVQALDGELRMTNFGVTTNLVSDNIPFGGFNDWLEESLEESIFVALVTDAYATRPWCRMEVLAAKSSSVPMIVVDALESIDRRTFPYLGNVPTIRWTGQNMQDVLDLAFQERLRFAHFRARVDGLLEADRIPKGARVLCRPPELLDCMNDSPDKNPTLSSERISVYPDPPLGVEELNVLAKFRPEMIFVTPTGANRSMPLRQLRVGISISNPPDLKARGLDTMHVEDALVEFVRNMLVQGANIAYGGSLQQSVLTELLISVTRTESSWDHRERRLCNYLAWPVHSELDLDSRAHMADTAEFRFVSPPQDLLASLSLDPTQPLALSHPQYRYVWARCLTAMREELTDACDALLMLGGKQQGFLGRYPGIVEEALLALQRDKPVFLIGGFGGSTLDLINMLRSNPHALTSSLDEREKSFVDDYNRRIVVDSPGAPQIDYSDVRLFFASRGVDGLRNGLNSEENERLFATVNLDECIFLVVTGLKRLAMNRSTHP